MLSRVSSLRFLAADVSKLAATRRTTPAASNLLLHTSAACNNLPKTGNEIKRPATQPDMKTILVTDQYHSEPVRYVVVALAGCGHGDGTNVLEAMSLAINLQRHDIQPHFYAANYKIQPFNHNTERVFDEGADPDQTLWEAPHYALMDAARLIDEKSIRDLHGLADSQKRSLYSGLFIPGGQGVLHDEFSGLVRRVIDDFHRDEKPIATIADGALLVCPQLRGVRITIGTTPRAMNDTSGAMLTAQALERAHGARLEAASSLEVVHCDKYKVYSTPGHLGCAPTFWDVHRGIERLVKAVKADFV